MRIERALPGQGLLDLCRIHDAPSGQFLLAAYFGTGEWATAGPYCCTFCGGITVLGIDGPLPLCSSCDSTEFLAPPGRSALLGGRVVGQARREAAEASWTMPRARTSAA
ncbi:MAG: hypothetical protein HYY04_17395 [Chloroflexi bacterium]|nr:hypothetical protein [Chloroflexota bacterium]